ncbi:hypothetical protein FXB38_33355 [Bradyrhizobium cytisi]|uniref:Uncharacterized protein n=1 Tax=Bradyrhizobium cytisi TaxID=515489 RepID=A0A5S4W1V7_9BRAD|nr:hypothetical protein FXB38_33355 [Bradyrhizobium cytisi]
MKQPLHASERSGDEGGNKLCVVLHAKGSNGTAHSRPSTFHSMWDDSLVDLQAYSWGSYADALDTNPLPTADAALYDEARIAARATSSTNRFKKRFRRSGDVVCAITSEIQLAAFRASTVSTKRMP